MTSALDISLTPPSPPSHQAVDKKPILLAAYKFGEPYRKRRVKVPPDLLWKDFLALFYSRLELNRDLDIEIFDENGIEIVSVDDLVDNDILVVREKKHPKPVKMVASSAGGASWSHNPGNRQGMASRNASGDPCWRSHDQAPPHHSTPAALHSSSSNRPHPGRSGCHTFSMMLGPPVLSHYIQCNSFGYYFLAEAENLKMNPVTGRSRKVHCVVKVPHVNIENLHVLEGEASLLRRISHHKSIISPPEVHVINFSDSKLQRFYSSVPQQKQGLLQQLFTMGGGPKDAYVYPLYGITMATKIKSGLTPDRVLKYAYQLADIMYYLQQNGVIHQSLLPENIQVMSNDRIIVCNFETAIQTDPKTCLMVVSAGVPPPSNRNGLAPELISAFVRLRIKPETVDYSTQYPWMFGVLCILIATGTHPLSDYPSKYEDNHKIIYRSHHVQSLPDPTKYPPVFMKLVKRTILCDPVRRPTLQQILTVFKRDPKILSLMTGNRLPVNKGRRGTLPATISKGVTQVQKHVTQDLLDVEPASQYQTSDKVLADTCGAVATPPVGFFCNTYSDQYHMTSLPPEQPFPMASLASTKSESQGAIGYSRSYDQSGVSHVDPPVHADTFILGNEALEAVGSKETWCNFTNNATSTSQTSSVAADRVPLCTRSQETTPLLKRYGSLSVFSDNFVLSDDPQGLTRVHSTGSLSLLSPPKPKQERMLEGVQGRRTEFPAPLSFASSDGEVKQMEEFPYQRLIHSPNVTSSQQVSPTCRGADDLEHLVHPSSMDINYTVIVPENTTDPQVQNTDPQVQSTDTQVQNTDTQLQNTDTLGQSTDPLVQSTDPGVRRSTAAAQSVSTGTGIPILVSTVENDVNLETTHLPSLGDLCSDVFLHIPILKGVTSSVVQSGDHHMTNNSAAVDTSPSEAGAIASQVSASVETPASVMGTYSAEVKEKDVSVEVLFSQGGQGEGEEQEHERNAAFSPDLSTSGSHPEGSDKEFWSGILGVGSDTGRLPGEEERVASSVSPQSVAGQKNGDAHGMTLSIDRDSDRSFASPSPSLGLQNMDLTLNNRQLSGEKDLQTRSEGVMSLVESKYKGGTANSHHSKQPSEDTSSKSGAAEGCNMMIPITEVSQEQTGSVSQHSINRHSVANLQSVSEQNLSSQSTMAESGQFLSQMQPVAIPIGTRVSDKGSTTVVSPTVVGWKSSSSGQEKPLVSSNHTDMYQDNLGEVSNSRQENGVRISEDGTQNESRRSTITSVVEGNVQIGKPARAVGNISGGDCGTDEVCVALTSTQTSANTNVELFADGAGLSSTTQQRYSNRGKGKSSGGVPVVNGHDNMLPTDSLQNSTGRPSMHRNSTLHSGASASSKRSNQGGPNRLESRPLSPLAMSARNSRNHSTPSTQCQLTIHGRGIDHMQHTQGDHGNQTLPQGRGQANQPCQQGRGRSSEHISRGRGTKSELCQLVGGRGVPERERQDITGRGVPQTPAQNGVTVNSSRMQHSQSRQPRQDTPRLQHRIKQDLEAMNCAISGMDSQTGAASFHYSMNSQSSMTGGVWPGDRRGAVSRHRRSEQTSRQHPHNPAQQSQQKISRLHQAQQQRYRIQQTQRTVLLSSSPRQSGEDSPSSTRAPITPQHQSDTVVNREAQSGSQGYHPRLRNAWQLSHGTGNQGHNATMMTNAPQPPQVTSDSYDYLPPYSPPLEAPTVNAQTHQQQQGQNRACLSGGAYPEPPPSYDEVFGGDELASSNQTRSDNRNVRDLDGSREQNGQTRFPHRERIHSNPSNHSTAISTTARPSGLGRLTSITNLFRRTPKTTHSEAEHHVVGVEDYTAQWVASYSHTPRPHTSQHLPSTHAMGRNSPTNTMHQQHHQNRPSHRPPQRSSSAAALAEYDTANCPVPYLHPPPFPLTHLSQQSDGAPTSEHSMVADDPSNLNLSVTCRPIPNSSGSQRSQGLVTNSQLSSRVRPRPSSAFYPSESRVLQFPDSSAATSQISAPTSVATPCQQAQLINNNTTIAASCTNISSEEKVKTSSGGLRRRGSERISRHRWFAYLKHTQRVPDPNTQTQPLPPRISAPTGNNVSQPEAECPHVPAGLEITPSQSGGSSNNLRALPPVGTSINNPPLTLRETNLEASNPTSLNSPSGGQVRTNSIPLTTTTISTHSSPNLSPKSNTHVTTGGGGTSTTPPPDRGGVDTSQGVIGDASSQVHSSSNSIDSSLVNSHSSRSAVRLRAEARRSLLTSSSEDDLLNELSQSTSLHGRPRMWRRRSQGSNSLVGGSQWSQESNLHGEHHTEVREEVVLGGEEGVEERDASAWQDGLMGGEQSDGCGDVRAVEEDTVQLDGGDRLSGQKENAQDIIDVDLSVADSAPSHVPGKSCGHECQGVGRALCCMCGRREERGITSSTIDTTNNNQCPLCARRLNSAEEEVFDPNTEMDITTSDHLDMKVTSIPHREHSSTSSQRTQNSNNNNCSVM